MCAFRIAIAGQHVAILILAGFLVIQLVGTIYTNVARVQLGWAVE